MLTCDVQDVAFKAEERRVEVVRELSPAKFDHSARH